LPPELRINEAAVDESSIMWLTPGRCKLYFGGLGGLGALEVLFEGLARVASWFGTPD
jgi:hypothetical protein